MTSSAEARFTPRDPTPEMYAAAFDALVPAADALACWRAMFDVAPPVPGPAPSAWEDKLRAAYLAGFNADRDLWGKEFQRAREAVLACLNPAPVAAIADATHAKTASVGPVEATPVSSKPIDDTGALSFNTNGACVRHALRWALSMAEEAIVGREAGENPEETPEIIAMHRTELDEACRVLAFLEDGQQSQDISKSRAPATGDATVEQVPGHPWELPPGEIAAAHTHAAWHVGELSPGKYYIFVDEERVLACLYDQRGPFPRATLPENQHRYEGQAKANAYMFAAAPKMLEALMAAVDCGMVPKSSATEPGAVRHSEQVRVADRIRAAIAGAFPAIPCPPAGEVM